MSKVQPQVIAEVRLLATAEGGRKHAIPTGRFGCLMAAEGQLFDCWLLLPEGHTFAPGQQQSVPIFFLDWEIAKNFLRLGTEFTLREVQPIGKGRITQLL